VSFTTPQIENLHRKIVPRILQKFGIKSTLPHPAVFAPRCSGDVGLIDIQAARLQTKIVGILKHVRANTNIGRIFLITIRWAQLLAGIHKSVLDETAPIPCVESRWIEHLCAGLHHKHAKIWLRETWELKPARLGDIFLMEHFMKQDFSVHQLRELNYC
jgi:hypothetical protein